MNDERRTVRHERGDTIAGLLLRGAPCAAPLRVRIVARDEPSIALTPRGYAQAGSVRAHIARDLAADVVSLLASGAQVDEQPIERDVRAIRRG